MRKTNLHPSNRVHETAYIEEGAIIGENNHFGPFSYIHSCSIIGSNCRFEGHCSIGTPPEHKGSHLRPNNPGVFIGNNVVIKEFVTINRGTTRETTIQDGVWMLRGSHAGHDSLIMANAVISCNVMIGGHSVIMDNANVGLGVVIHQHRCIGSYCMVGMGAVVNKSVPPFMIAYGNPIKCTRLNTVGMKRCGFSDKEILDLGEYADSAIESFAFNQVMIVPTKIKSVVELWKKLKGGSSALCPETQQDQAVRELDTISKPNPSDPSVQSH